MEAEGPTREGAGHWSPEELDALLSFVKLRKGRKLADVGRSDPVWSDLENGWEKRFGTHRTAKAIGEKHIRLRRAAENPEWEEMRKKERREKKLVKKKVVEKKAVKKKEEEKAQPEKEEKKKNEHENKEKKEKKEEKVEKAEKDKQERKDKKDKKDKMEKKESHRSEKKRKAEGEEQERKRAKETNVDANVPMEQTDSNAWMGNLAQE
mmetsp:Transcript_7972/g.15893  ORF Transcript_7972/g.15893 Transcript_7972/m.15893 type:complete len:208 (+) Transcript_7972:153-776(+)